MRTAKEIVDQTNELARQFYAVLGYQVDQGFHFDQATHPQEVQMWHLACLAQEMLTDTDLQDVLDELDEHEYR